jgi:hypothetical protein
MPVLARPLPLAAIFGASIAVSSCNWVLGINEPEEIGSPTVRYYPWDGNTGEDPPSTEDASDSLLDVSPERPNPPSVLDALNESRPGATPIVDARSDGPRCLLRLPDAGGKCGLGCDVLCPLEAACLRNSDCRSSQCYAGRCTLTTCLNRIPDGDETDVDCGGSCAACSPGQRCRSANDCASLVCNAWACQALLQDASADGRRPYDGSITDANIVPDVRTSDGSGAAEAGDGHTLTDALPDSIAVPDAEASDTDDANAADHG